ncbi:MAG: pyridoxal-phosphate dependent enzyme [Cyclobacteriaceae bacterium]|nr:pyridoxal-phosphate dependent enzyme [Cyclobacteriaceae bacterium]MCH8515431.1 pyridoxal-phosphate dependent enzyme [Cyclobacteriaceae bacterium]
MDHLIALPDMPQSRLQEVERHLYVLREDELHPLVSGNKYRKLLPNIAAMRAARKQGILTFGGAFSNHIFSTAAAGMLEKVPTLGFIRGEESSADNPTLGKAAAMGMKLQFLDRTTYRMRYDSEWLAQLQSQYPDYYLVPEGGGNEAGVLGCESIADQLISLDDFDIYLAAGTGSTAAGIIRGLHKNKTKASIYVVAALKGGDFLRDEMDQYLPDADMRSSYELLTDYHFGGYAKWKPELITFMNDWYKKTQIPLEPIYTAKAAYAMMQLRKPHRKSVLIHTGGLQGLAGFRERFGELLRPKV